MAEEILGAGRGEAAAVVAVVGAAAETVVEAIGVDLEVAKAAVAARVIVGKLSLL